MTTHVTLERLITFLLQTPMFDNLEPAEIKQLVDIVDVKELAAGDTLFKEGAPGDAWYAMYRGRVDVIKDVGEDQKEIYPLGKGACFGEIAILDGKPRSATIKAIEDCVVLKISRSDFQTLLDQDHIVAYKLLRNLAINLAQRVRSTTERLSELVQEAESVQSKRRVTQLVGTSYLRD